jgi:hypothetical protein
MIRQAEQKQKRAIQDYNRAVTKYNREVKKAVSDYDREARAHNAQVRRNRQRLRSELTRLSRQPTRVTIRTHVTYRASVEVLQTSFDRLESSPARSGWGADGEELFDLAEGEAANSVRSLNVLLDPSGTRAEDSELQQTTLNEELAELSPDLDKRWRGALYSLHPANPDAARHFCTSSREILVTVLDLEAPDESVLAGIPECPTTDDGRPTRRAKIQYVLTRKALASPELVDFVDKDLENVSSLFRVFNSATHGSAGTYDLVQLASLKGRVEDAIRFIHRLVR